MSQSGNETSAKNHSLPVLPDPDRLARVEARAAAASEEPTAMTDPFTPPAPPVAPASSASSASPSPASSAAPGPAAAPPSPASAPSLSDEQRKTIEEQVVRVLKTIYDPEIPINIHELGLIYGVEVTPSGVVNIRMTLTAPACPVAESLPLEVESRVQAIPEVTSAYVNLVWDPPWDQDRMSEAAKLALGLL